MKMSPEEIKNKISDGNIRCLSIDTSIFHENNYRYEHGTLSSIKQFKNTGVSFLLSDVIFNEVLSHTKRDAAESQRQTTSALKNVGKTWQIDRKTRDAAMEMVFGKISPEEQSKIRIDKFIQETNANILHSDGLTTFDKVLNLYFSSSPPFAFSGTKKNEFPDAIALTTLEEWGKRENTLILVASKDNDWKNFCEKSETLILVKDLAEALSYFHQDEQITCELIAQLIVKNDSNNNSEIFDAIAYHIDSVNFIPEISSGYFFDSYIENVELTDIDLSQIDSDTIKIIDKPDDESIVIETQIDITATVTSSFNFSITDPIDKDEVSIGSATVDADAELDATLVLYFEKSAESTYRLIDTDVNFTRKNVTIEYGDVEPDWSNDFPED